MLWRNHASGRCGECPLCGPFPPFGQQPLSAQLRRPRSRCERRSNNPSLKRPDFPVAPEPNPPGCRRVPNRPVTVAISTIPPYLSRLDLLWLVAVLSVLLIIPSRLILTRYSVSTSRPGRPVGAVQICFGDKSTETCEGDIDRVAKHLGFEIARDRQGAAEKMMKLEHWLLGRGGNGAVNDKLRSSWTKSSEAE